MVNKFKKVSIRKTSDASVARTSSPAYVPGTTSTLDLASALPGAILLRPVEERKRPDTSQISFLRTTMRAIQREITSGSRRKHGLAKIIADVFEFDNTRVYIKEGDTIYLLGESSQGPFREASTYADRNKSTRNGKNKILQTLEEMSAKGQHILRFDLRYALFLWEDDPQVARMIEEFKLEKDEEKIALMRRIAPNKSDVLKDINFYLFYNKYFVEEGIDHRTVPLETTFIALVNGEKKVHGYIMANNFITGRALDYDEVSLRETAEVILDTFKIYETLEAEKRKAQEAEQRLAAQNVKLKRQTIMDGLLDNLHSRSYFNEIFPVTLADAINSGTQVGITFIDIDHFKIVNDTYGHEAGDIVLKGIAKIIEEECRKIDMPCRYGGEELAILTTSVEDVSQLVAMAKRIREKVNSTVFEHAGNEIRITLSIGIAMGNSASVLTLSDTAMYHSKNNGRDKIVIHSIEMSRMQPVIATEEEEEEEEHIIFIDARFAVDSSHAGRKVAG